MHSRFRFLIVPEEVFRPEVPNPDMRLSDFAYELPQRLIAQVPATPRDASRMLVVNRPQKTWQDAHFADFPSFVQPNDAVVLNNTKVFPARLIGEKKASAGRVELFLIREREPGIWEVLVKPARKIGVGTEIKFSTSSDNGTTFTTPVVAATSTINLFIPSRYTIPAQPSRGISADPSIVVEESHYLRIGNAIRLFTRAGRERLQRRLRGCTLRQASSTKCPRVRLSLLR